MEDSGSVTAIASFMTKLLGPRRAILAVVIAGALVTYGGVSLFVAFFVLAPMAQQLFRAAGIPRRLMPAAIALGTSTFTMSALPGTPAIQNAIPMPFFGTTPFAAPGLGIIASIVMFGFGMWWLDREEATARRSGEGFGDGAADTVDRLAVDEPCASVPPPPTNSNRQSSRMATAARCPSGLLAALPLVVVIIVNLAMSLVILPRIDPAFLAEADGAGRRSPLSPACGPSLRRWPAPSPRSSRSAAAPRPCRRRWTPARTHPSCPPSASPASSASARWWPRCRPSCLCATPSSAFRGGPLVPGGRHQYPRGSHRLGLRRADHRARRARSTYLARAARSAWIRRCCIVSR